MQARTGFFLASALCALMVAAPMGALAVTVKKSQPHFNDRYPAPRIAPPPAAEPAPTRKQRTSLRATRVVTAKRPRSRVVVVVPRSYLDAGTEVLPGERKFLDYAFPPPTPRWTWSPIPAVASAGTIRPCPARSSPRVTEFRCPLFSRGSAQPFERIPIG